MTDDQIELILSLITGEVDCSLLHRAANGYDIDGGKYDTFQQSLDKNGWRYDINTDSWKLRK